MQGNQDPLLGLLVSLENGLKWKLIQFLLEFKANRNPRADMLQTSAIIQGKRGGEKGTVMPVKLVW